MADAGSVEEMKEKLSKMSPEELKEFQKQRCIFCQIVAGKVASKKIYSDDKCTALLDINPANPGHIVIIPNEHHSIMPLMPPEDIRHIFMVAKALSQASLKALDAQGTNIFVANGLAAGQKAQHFMVHIIPRKEGDKFKLDIPEKSISEPDLNAVIERLKIAIGNPFGQQPELKKLEKEELKPKIAEQSQKKQAPEIIEKVESAEEIIEEPKELPKPARILNKGEFITSETARRFHSEECPFAQNISEDSRIYITQAEAEIRGKLPCSCTGLKGKKAEKKPAAKNAVKKTASAKKQHTIQKEEASKKNQKNNEPANLDDIARLLGGRG